PPVWFQPEARHSRHYGMPHSSSINPFRSLGVPGLPVRQQQSMHPAIQHRLTQRHSALSFKSVLNPGVNPPAIGPGHGVAIEAFRFSKPVRFMLPGLVKIHAPVLDDLAGLAISIRKIPGIHPLSEPRGSDAGLLQADKVSLVFIWFPFAPI